MTGVAHELGPKAVEALAAAAEKLLEEGATDQALVALVEAVAAATRADVAIVRTASSPAGELVSRSVEASSPSLASDF
jgi:predicted ATP-grasp superfamily ATP-dependent carboligase